VDVGGHVFGAHRRQPMKRAAKSTSASEQNPKRQKAEKTASAPVRVFLNAEGNPSSSAHPGLYEDHLFRPSGWALNRARGPIAVFLCLAIVQRAIIWTSVWGPGGVRSFMPVWAMGGDGCVIGGLLHEHRAPLSNGCQPTERHTGDRRLLGRWGGGGTRGRGGAWGKRGSEQAANGALPDGTPPPSVHKAVLSNSGGSPSGLPLGDEPPSKWRCRN